MKNLPLPGLSMLLAACAPAPYGPVPSEAQPYISGK